MGADRGWIGEPQPPKEWHMPGWVKTGGHHFISRQADRVAARQAAAQYSVEYRRDIARWQHLKHVDRRGNPADDLTAGHPTGPALPLAPRYTGRTAPAPIAMTELTVARHYFAGRNT